MQSQAPAPLNVEPVKIGGISPIEQGFEGIVNLIVRTLHPDYNGVVFGVRFTDGQAVVNRHTRNPRGYSLAQLAAKFTTDLPGYLVYVEYPDGRIEPPLPERAPVDESLPAGLTPDQAAARLSVSRGRPAQRGKVKED